MRIRELTFYAKFISFCAMNIFSLSNEPLKVSLLVLPQCSLMSLACTLDPMRAANRLSRDLVFDWQILTLDGNPVMLTCGLPVACDQQYGSGGPADVLIIIAGFDSEAHTGKNMIINIAGAAARYRVIGGVEAGSWIMARAGLLNNHRATTHWEDLEDFAARFPHIDVVADRFVVDGRRFTTGGASPAFDFMLHLVRARKGAPFAMEVASVFSYDDIHAATDAQGLAALGRLEVLEPKIAAAIKLMEASLDNPLSIATIARRTNTSIRSLESLFQSLLATTPGKHYRYLRLQLARRLLVDTRLSVQQIAVRAGFSSSSAFSRAIKRQFGKSPRALRQ